MKRKQLIISVSLALTILCSILFQSVHSYEHTAKQLSEQQCHHQYDKKQGGITHQHHNYELCYVCHFAFGSSLIPEVFNFEFTTFHKDIPYFFTASENLVTFSTSAYLLRGPPASVIA
ncbi:MULTISPECIES: hypothetical protein [Flavobacterium]|uniref:DUF2946 domain-containing protein n=2 Tax=Flavobacterium TaxID=237 RepID=A0A941AZA8_9FLAO|nr:MULTISPECIES: hypothetical protein [Flavobacterium]MBP4138747.1 hypothetical protein [Flavobacterium geliluteum]MDX6181224.1 hypothetical protein [Flavobacterium sp. Fl-33]MDX6184825.1 hypothetical protein [Flavobacterium sp. Fl-77]UFH39922.1 hypothetical protein LNP22_06500 [Flavobacterium sp. F-70]